MFKKIDNYLTKVGLIITNIVSTMYCAIAFCILALISLPGAIASHSLITIIGWTAQTFLQLVLLSIIMVGQTSQSNAAQEKLDKILEAILRNEEKILQEEDEILKKEGLTTA